MSKSIKFSLSWESDEDFHFAIANFALINFDDDHFYLRFYQASPPTILDLDDTPEHVKAKLVGGVAIPASRMDSVIRAMSDSARKFEQAREVEPSPSDEEREGGENDD